MRNYKFTAICKSGQSKIFEFEAVDYTAARKKLKELIDSN